MRLGLFKRRQTESLLKLSLTHIQPMQLQSCALLLTLLLTIPAKAELCRDPSCSLDASYAGKSVSELEVEIVAAVQRRMLALGFNAGRADGIWGPRTSAAFEAFLRSNNLEGHLGLTREVIKALWNIDYSPVWTTPVQEAEFSRVIEDQNIGPTFEPIWVHPK